MFAASAFSTACGEGSNGGVPGTGGGGADASASMTTSQGGTGGDQAASSTASTGGGAGASAASSASASGSGGSGPVEPDFDTLMWEVDGDVGFGVARKDAQNPLGNNAFIGYGGYDVTRDEACAWTTELYHATLRDRGVRYVYCVQGPSDPSYSKLEIGNSKIAKKLVTQVDETTSFVLVAAHSSGSFVAHELLGQLATGLDPTDVTAGRVVYFNLDGGQSGLDATKVERLRKAYFVSARNPITGTSAPNRATMQNLGATYASKGSYLELDGTNSGCSAGATWCMHMVPILSKPHDPNAATAALDYTDFVNRPVTTAFIGAKAIEAGLVP